MRNTRTETGLIAHSKALEAAGIAIPLVLRVPAPLKCLADQVIRSASSVPANLSEGHGRSGRDRINHWRIAYASAKEVDTHLRLLTGAGAIDCTQASTAIQLFDAKASRRPRRPGLRIPAYTTPVHEDSSYAVIVVTHDHVGTLPACFEALAALDPAPAEIVVVDNASSDGSAEFAETRTETGLRLIREATNTGFAAAVNRGLSETSAPWVLLLNPDCAPRPDFVVRMFAAAEQARNESEIGSITGRLIRSLDASLTPGKILDAAGMVVTSSGRHFDRGAGEPDDGRYSSPAWVFGGTGAATLYRRAALRDVAYPDGQILAESFFAYREDAELAWRLQWRNWRCLYAPEAVAVHGRGFQPEAGRRGHETTNRLSVRNRFLLRMHCADLGWHLRCFPWWKLRDLLVIGGCLTIELSSLPALAEVWRGRDDALTRRRWVLSRRKASSRRISRWFRKRHQVVELKTEAS